MPLRPLQDRIVVDVYEAETRTAGGLFIPDTATEKGETALMKAAGNGHLEGWVLLFCVRIVGCPPLPASVRGTCTCLSYCKATTSPPTSVFKYTATWADKILITRYMYWIHCHLLAPSDY